jgi:uncharacterized protein YndB with AHSA1/START domain
MTTAAQTTFVAEPGSNEATISAVIDAPRDKVFRAYTEPDLFTAWWGPEELTTKVDVFDAVAGGSWRVLHVDPSGGEYGFRGVFHSVSPDMIVQTFEFEGLPGHVCLQTAWFEDLGDGRTRVVNQSVFQSVADRDGMKDSGMEEHAPVGMAQLARVVATL